MPRCYRGVSLLGAAAVLFSVAVVAQDEESQRVVSGPKSVREPRLAPLSDAVRARLAKSREAIRLRVIPESLSVEIGSDEPNAVARRLEQRRALVDWVVTAEFGGLSNDRRDTLRATLQRAGERALSIHAETEGAKMQPEVGQKAMAALMAEIILAEREAYRGLPDAQRAHFGKVIGNTHPTQDDLAKLLLPFITGEALAATATVTQRPVPAPLPPVDPSTLGPAVALPLHIPQQPGVSTRTVERSEDATFVAAEGRVFVAEHPIFPMIPIPEIEKLVHASVVAGVWVLVNEKKLIEVYEVQPAPRKRPGVAQWPETVAQMLKRLKGTLVKRQRVTTDTWRFQGWMWGNGCSGSYESYDTLTLVKRVPDAPTDDWESMIRELFSYTANSSGTYCRNRATAYPKGVYGLSWVCHQNANAFLRRRLGISPVFHLLTFVPYGAEGNAGVSTCNNWKKEAMSGCVPGEECEGNLPPYALPCPQMALFEWAATGFGQGLDRVWNKKKQQWLASEAKFVWRDIDIPGLDDAPAVTIEDLPLS